MREDFWNSSVARQLPPSSDSYYGVKKKEVLQPQKRFSGSEKILYLCSVIFCVALSLIIISKHATITELNLEMRKMENRFQEVEKMNYQLESEREKLASIDNVRKFAESKGLELSLPQILPSIQH